MPEIEKKRATIGQYPGMKECDLCRHEFTEEETFRIVEEDGPFDNDWYAICKLCLGTQKYVEFIKNNCVIIPQKNG